LAQTPKPAKLAEDISRPCAAPPAGTPLTKPLSEKAALPAVIPPRQDQIKFQRKNQPRENQPAAIIWFQPGNCHCGFTFYQSELLSSYARFCCASLFYSA
jgi:hypothetical protein